MNLLYVYKCLCAKSCLTLCDPMGVCSLTGFSVYGTFQARMLEWFAISYSIYSLCFGLPSHSGYHRALSRVPCAIQYFLISSLFYTQYQ